MLWEIEQQYFSGEVGSYEPNLQHPFTINYDDGDTEDGVFYEDYFLTDEDVKRPYNVIGEVEKPAVMRKSASEAKEHRSVAPKEPALQSEVTAEQNSAKETAPRVKATVNQQESAAARKVAPEVKAVIEHKPPAQEPLQMPAPAVAQKPAPGKTPGSRPSSAGFSTPTPQSTLLTPGILSKFQQVMQKHTSGSARNATSPSTPDRAGSQRTPAPAAGLVLGTPVPGPRGPMKQRSPAGPSRTTSNAVPAQEHISAAGVPVPNQGSPPGVTAAAACTAMPTGVSTSLGPATQPRRPVSKLDSLIPDWQATRHTAVVRAQPSPGHSPAVPKQAQQPAGDAQGVATQPGIREASVANGSASEVAGSAASLQDPLRPGAASAAPSRLAAASLPAHTAEKGSGVSKADAAAPALGTAAHDVPERKRGRLPKDAESDTPPAKKRGRLRKVVDTGEQQQQQQQGNAADDAKIEVGACGWST